MRTYETRIDPVNGEVLDDYGALFGRALRTLYARRRARIADNKPEFMRAFALTSRQFNAVRITLDAMRASICQRRLGRLRELDERLRAVDAKLARVDSAFVRHQLTRRRARLAAMHARAGNETICFGSRKLFAAQHHLPANGLSDHDAWRKVWRDARSRQFFVLGSSDETAGCQGCVLTALGDGCFAVRLRLPNTSACKYLQTIVRFRYGAEAIEAALARGQAMSYRFLRDQRGWRVFVSTRSSSTPVATDASRGVVGVDLNVDHVAWSETDRCGNVVDSGRIGLCTYGVSQRVATTMTAQAVKELIAIATQRCKPIGLECLDFARKKAQLSYASARRARMLSSFAYRRFELLLRARGADGGIAIVSVNPAYSSKIGRQKYARRYGLSVHQSAALVLARRAQGLHDRYVRSGGRHGGSTREDRRAHVSAAKRAEGRSKAGVAPREPSPHGDPNDVSQRGWDPTVRAGGSPARQSSGTRVRPASVARLPVGVE